MDIFRLILILLGIVFMFPARFLGGLAYDQWQDIREMRTSNTLELTYILEVDDPNNTPPEILVRIPEKWRAGASYKIEYAVVSLGQPPQDVELTIGGGLNLKGIDTVNFYVGGKPTADQVVTVSKDARYLTHLHSIGIIQSDTGYTVSEPIKLTVIGSSYWWLSGFRLAISFVLFIALLGIAIALIGLGFWG